MNMKRIAKDTVIGVIVGLFIYNVICVVIEIIYKGNLSFTDWYFSKMLFATVVVALGFSLPSFIYEKEGLSMGLKVLFQMGIGCTVMLITAFYAGWIPVEAGWKIGTVLILTELMTAFIIWLFMYRHYKKMAMQMNEKLKERENTVR